jgi:hypothetical protein
MSDPQQGQSGLDFSQAVPLAGAGQSGPTPKVPDVSSETKPLVPGNIDLNNRPTVQNEDGSQSTEYSTSFGTDRGEVLVPTIVNGKFLTPDGKKPKEGSAEEKAMFKRAREYYEKSGEHMGIFANPKDADAYAQLVHNRSQVNQKFDLSQPQDLGSNLDFSKAISYGVQNPNLDNKDSNHGLLDKIREESGSVQSTNPLDDLKSNFEAHKRIAIGTAKSIGETGHTLGRLLNMTTGDSIKWLPSSLKEPESLKADGALEGAGKVGETIAEFMIGDEALKGLSIAERLGLAEKISVIAQKSPVIARLLGVGIQASRQGVVTGAQTAAHGHPEEAVKQGLMAAGVGAGAGALVEGAGAGVRRLVGSAEKEDIVEESINKLREKGLPTGSPEIPATKIPSTASEPPQATMHEPVLQNSFRQAVNDLARKEGLKNIPDTTDLREIGQQLSKRYYQSSKTGFDEVKTATGIDVNFLRDELENLEFRKAKVFGNAEAEGHIIERMNTLQDELNSALAEAKEKGVNVEKPLQDWKKSKAAGDLDKQIKMSVDPAMKSGTFDPSKLSKRIETLYRPSTKYPNQPGRLEQLFGKDVAENLRDDTYAAADTQRVLKNFKPRDLGDGVDVPAVSARDSHALYNLIRPATGRVYGPEWFKVLGPERTNWSKVYQAFDKLTPTEKAAQFSDASQVDKLILKEARIQTGKMVAAGMVGGVIAAKLGITTAGLIKKLLIPN